MIVWTTCFIDAFCIDQASTSIAKLIPKT